MTESVESPERIWIESEGGCPYFYHEDLQVEEQQGPEHISSPDCWCEPELDYKDPDTGAEVWVHRGLQ